MPSAKLISRCSEFGVLLYVPAIIRQTAISFRVQWAAGLLSSRYGSFYRVALGHRPNGVPSSQSAQTLDHALQYSTEEMLCYFVDIVMRGTDFRLTYLVRSVYNAKVTPSPSSSARRTIRAYLIVTTKVRVQI